MISEIYYFSGTGNSLAIARKLDEKLLNKSEIIPITNINGKRTIKADRVGFIFPVYIHKIPDVVRQFILNIEFVSSPYIYAIATHNGEIGQSLFEVKALLAKKGHSLSLGSEIAMPGNAFVTEPDIELERLSMSDQKVVKLAGLIENQTTDIIDGKNGLIEQIRNQIVGVIAWNYVLSPKRFKVSNDCIGCNQYVKVCPVNNIQLVTHQPHWKNECTACLACFHWCPKEAIYMNNSHIGKRRKYHHPDIEIIDMFEQSGAQAMEIPNENSC